ncbi:MAG: hypothetical protein AAB353_13630 [Candidatus Hydrogenedentota bacterium]
MKAIVAAVLVCIAAAMAAGPAGTWNVVMDYQGSEIPGTLVIKDEGGKLSGTWEGRRGKEDVRDLSFENGKLSFVRTVDVQGQQFDITFTGTIDGEALTGAFDSAMGALAVKGKLASAAPAGAAPAAASGGTNAHVGKWNAHVSSSIGEFDHHINVNADGTGAYDADGTEIPLTDITLDGDKLTFKMTIDVNGQQLPLTFAGKVAGDDLTGDFTSDAGSGSVVARRDGAAPAIVGTWDVTVVSPLGENKRTIVVNKDLTGAYITDSGEYALSNVKQTAKDVTFDVTVKIQEQDVALKFAGIVDGNALNGKFTSDAGEGVVTGTKAGQVGAAGADPEIQALLTGVLDALKALDIEKLVSFYADDYKDNQGADKAQTLTQLNDAKGQGVLDGIHSKLDRLRVSVNGDKATLDNIGIEGSFGVLNVTLGLEKRAGKWWVVTQSQQ